MLVIVSVSMVVSTMHHTYTRAPDTTMNMYPHDVATPPVSIAPVAVQVLVADSKRMTSIQWYVSNSIVASTMSVTLHQ